MGKIAFVFSGQGAQHSGMGRSFYDNVPEAKKIFEEAEALRPGTLDQCFHGSKETLRRTDNTQPCLYLAGLAAAVSLKYAGIEAEGAAGFSLGEIPALAYGGAYTFLDGFRISCKRGELMQKASEDHPAAMAAVLKLDHSTVESICERYDNIFPVNYNCPGQLVVSGDKRALDAVKAEVGAAGGKLLPLNVGGGFHSPFMDGAARSFGEFLDSVQFNTPRLTVYSNFSSKPYGDNIQFGLKKQITHPVRWDAIVTDMYANGFDTFVEVGAGDTLTKLIQRIIPEARAVSADSWEKAEQIKELINA